MKKIYLSFKICLIALALLPLCLQAQQCAGTPGANTVVPGLVVLCPGSGTTFSLANTYTATGIAYQWEASISSAIGPFTVVPNATLNTYATPVLNGTMWYRPIITCTANSSFSIAAVAGQASVQSVVTNTPPYYEGFSGLTSNNQLPNCSWQASNLGVTCLTYSTGGFTPGQAAFFHNPPGVNYFYSNGLQLYAGVTYSTTIWYKTDNTGGLNWTNLAILTGTNQSLVNQQLIVTTNGAVVAATYTSLSGLFTVPANGIYYMSVRGTGTNTGSSQYLYWDDLTVIVPCGQYNPVCSGPTITPATSSVCGGATLNLNAPCVADTYSWSNGATSPSIIYTTAIQGGQVGVSVLITKTTTGCSNVTTMTFTVKPSPILISMSTPPQLCVGGTATLTTSGASTFTWNNGGSGSVITVSPSTSTGYTVIGTNTAGCTGKASFFVNVVPLPDIKVISSSPTICAGESMILTGVGNTGIFQWVWQGLSSTVGTVAITPTVNTTYTVTGTDANGCATTTTYAVYISECLGLENLAGNDDLFKIYPNPSNGNFNVETLKEIKYSLVVTDLQGRSVMQLEDLKGEAIVKMDNFPAGVYFAKIKANEVVRLVKIIKQE